MIGTYVIITATKAAQMQYDNDTKAQYDTMKLFYSISLFIISIF